MLVSKAYCRAKTVLGEGCAIIDFRQTKVCSVVQFVQTLQLRMVNG
jgi:hypothetical protein